MEAGATKKIRLEEEANKARRIAVAQSDIPAPEPKESKGYCHKCKKQNQPIVLSAEIDGKKKNVCEACRVADILGEGKG